MLPNNLASDFRMKLGTLSHEWFETVTRGLPCMTEVKMDAGLPEGWSGTADLLLWDQEVESFRLVDLKTVEDTGMAWIERDGIKHEHHAQASAYWMAATRMGLPMWREYSILYLPTGQMPPGRPQVEPLLLSGTPDPRVFPVMEERWALTKAYVEDVEYARQEIGDRLNSDAELFVRPPLAPIEPRGQKLMRPSVRGASSPRDVILVPPWYCAYCPFDDSLCACGNQGTTKIGSWSQNTVGDWEYTPRKGYEDVEVTVEPRV